MITGQTFLRQQDMSKVMYISKMTFVSTLLKQDRKVKNEKKTKKNTGTCNALCVIRKPN